MSKSRKKQRAREQARTEQIMTDTAGELALPEPDSQPLNQVLYDLAIAAATNAGQPKEEGDRLVFVYNGDALALKYVAPGASEEEFARLLVAAFKCGVVYQVEGDRQLAYQPGDWEKVLALLADAGEGQSLAEVDPDISA